MVVEHEFKIRKADKSEDILLAEHFYCMWRDNDISLDDIRPEWLNITTQFIERVRRELCYQSFVAEVGENIVGSVGCQLFDGLYPNVLKDSYRKYGYIWGVYVELAYRKRGIAKQLTLAAMNHLRTIGCTRVLLHASPSGKAVYSQLGFSDTNEMRLDLV